MTMNGSDGLGVERTRASIGRPGHEKWRGGGSLGDGPLLPARVTPSEDLPRNQLGRFAVVANVDPGGPQGQGAREGRTDGIHAGKTSGLDDSDAERDPDMHESEAREPGSRGRDSSNLLGAGADGPDAAVRASLASSLNDASSILMGVGTAISDDQLNSLISMIDFSTDKDTFIITTRTNGQLTKLVPQDKLWEMSGDARYLQCSLPCHDELYEADAIGAGDGSDGDGGSERNDPDASRLDEDSARSDASEPRSSLRGGTLPDGPRCPRCHRALVPWVRTTSGVFLEGAAWEDGATRYRAFLDRHLSSSEVGDDVIDGGKAGDPVQSGSIRSGELLLLEVGTHPGDGRRPDGEAIDAHATDAELISQPFWSIASLHPEARLAVVD